MNLADIRKQYQMAELNLSDCNDDPIIQFKAWMDEAISAEVREATSMILATIDAEGLPHGRVVLLKDIVEGQFVFYTNYESDKGQQMSANPAVALTFFWPQLERQIRIEGSVSRQDKAESERYFQSRPRDSQLSAWASPQSNVVSSKADLIKLRAEVSAKFEGLEKLPLPPNWGGYQVNPSSIEFWQGRPSRYHDRIKYQLKDNGWTITRLAP